MPIYTGTSAYTSYFTGQNSSVPTNNAATQLGTITRPNSSAVRAFMELMWFHDSGYVAKAEHYVLTLTTYSSWSCLDREDVVHRFPQLSNNSGHDTILDGNCSATANGTTGWNIFVTTNATGPGAPSNAKLFWQMKCLSSWNYPVWTAS